MVIAGARGHALEILGVLHENKYVGKLYLFDDVNEVEDGSMVFGKFPVINSVEKLASLFINDSNFIIGTGGTTRRSESRTPQCPDLQRWHPAALSAQEYT